MLARRRIATAMKPRFANPRYWPSRCGIAMLWCVTRLPLALQLRIGALIGWLGLHFATRRRHIAAVNLQLCLPDWSDAARDRLLAATFRSAGISLLETALAWLRPPDALAHRVTISGIEHLNNALAASKGVLMIGGHFATLDIAGAMLARVAQFAVTYRPSSDPLFESIMRRARQRLYDGVIAHGDARSIARRLRAGGAVWYAADQDFGLRHSVFAPFFGVPAATITAVSRFARMNDSRAVFVSFFRDESPWRWRIDIRPLPTTFGTDAQEDALLINSLIEAEVRRAPEQYLWLHRRFKTRPPGETRPY